ncbi:MAG TPA: septum site-determining protein MinC [Kofleriaceae bacterium]|jgi:septum site-determining protein MinC
MLPLSTASENPADQAAGPAIILRGTSAGLEIVVDPQASVDAIGDALIARLDQSPGFFAGNDVAVRIDGRLPTGALSRLEQVTARYGMRIAEVGPPPRPPRAQTVPPTPVAEVAPPPVAVDEVPIVEAEPEPAYVPEPQPLHPLPIGWEGPRVLVGPVRSGVMLDAQGDLVILGDVNPGAEIHARGNIIVLGRLRGVAHAAVGGERGFILALRLEPQQIRIGKMVARAGDADRAGEGAEIAHATGKSIVVERYQGKVPT